MSEVFDKAVKEAGLASLGEAEPDLHPLPQSKLSISKKRPVSKELYEGISGVYPPERVIPPGYIDPLDYVEHPSQIPEFIKSFRKEERTSQRNPEGLTATEQMHRRFPSIDPHIGSMHLTDVEEGRTGIFPHPKGSFKEGFDITDWENSQLGIDFLKYLSHEGGKYPYEAGAEDPEGIQAIETFKGILGPTGSLLLPSLTRAALKGATDPTVMRMFVGEEAKLPKQTMKDLDRAKRLAENGRDRDYVYDQTGWFQDPRSKNKWKFEISDAEARIKQNIDFKKPNLTLKDVLHHPELYKVHPEFKKHPVTRYDAEAISTAHYRHETGEIYVKPFLDTTIRSRLEYMDRILHPSHRKMKTLTQKNKIRMRELLSNFGYRTKKEIEKIPDKQLKNIIEKEVVEDYNKLKELVPHYLTHKDWLINQRKLGAVPNNKQYGRLLKPENFRELLEIRGTRGIWEPDYIHIPEKPNGRMWSEQTTQALKDELLGYGSGDRHSIQAKIRHDPLKGRDYRKKPGATDDFRFSNEVFGHSDPDYIGRTNWKHTSEQRIADTKLEEKLLNDLTEKLKREPLDKGYFESAVRYAAKHDSYRDAPHGLFPNLDGPDFNKFVKELEPFFMEGMYKRDWRKNIDTFVPIRAKFGDKIANDIKEGFKTHASNLSEDVPFQRWKDTSGFGHEIIGNEYLGYRHYLPGSSKPSSHALELQDAIDNARRAATSEYGRQNELGIQYINKKGKPITGSKPRKPKAFPQPQTYIEKGSPLQYLYDPEMLHRGQSRESLKSFLHEGQHGMQQRSGFDPGTSWSGKLGWPDQLKYMRRDLEEIGAKIETKKQPGLFQMEEAIPETKLRHEPFPEWMTDEFFHYPVSINYKGKKYSIEEGKESWPSELANHLPSSDYHALREMNKLGKKREAYWEYHHGKPPKGSEAPEFYLKGHEGRKAMSGKEQYLTKSGEAEARNVERRYDLPAQTFPRKDKDIPRPWETLDVKEEMLWSADPYSRSPYPFLPKKKTGGGLSGLGEK